MLARLNDISEPWRLDGVQAVIFIYATCVSMDKSQKEPWAKVGSIPLY